jgi:uncharacterized protein (TIGR02598 family)
VKQIKTQAGFSIAEVILALGLLSVAVLALIGLATTALQARQKSDDTVIAKQVAESQLTRVIELALDDEAYRNSFFDASGTEPFNEGNVTVGDTEYSFSISVNDLNLDVEPNRLVKVEAVVSWWGGEESGRQGAGRLSTKLSRLVNEPTPGDAP